MSGAFGHTRLEAIDWLRVSADLDAKGWATETDLLSDAECDATAALYKRNEGFRSHVVVARHGFGKGEYRYFSYRLPPLIKAMRAGLYASLAPLANRWHQRMSFGVRFPADHASFLEMCHAVGQLRPTPLLLHYGAGDYNCLHQDLYGYQVFPIQVAVLLSEPAEDFDGGEFVITEQRPRMQSRPADVPLRKGDAVIFAVNSRPVVGGRGDYQVKLRHGVSEVRWGQRHTLGIIFHDAL